MASPEEIAPLLPETLPEDFGDWDSEASPAPSAVRLWPPARMGNRSFLRQSSKAVWAIEKPRRISRIPDGKAECFGSAAEAPVLIKQPKDFFDWEKETPAAPLRSQSEEQDAREADRSSDESQSRPRNMPIAMRRCRPLPASCGHPIRSHSRQPLTSRKGVPPIGIA